MQQWEKLAVSAERIHAYFKNADSLKTFLLNMGLVKKEAIQNSFGGPAIRMEGSRVLSFLFEKNGRYVKVKFIGIPILIYLIAFF